MSLKEYLYLDSKYLNSSLAQLNEGLPTSQHSGVTDTENDGETNSNSVNGGVTNLLNLGFTLQKKASTESEHKISNSTQEVIDSVLDDYAVQILQGHLNDKTLNTPLEANEGDFVNFSSEFKIYDFKFLSTISSQKNMELIRQQDDSVKAITGLQNQITNLKEKRKNVSKGKRSPYDAKIQKLIDQKNILDESYDNSGWENISMISDVATFFNNAFPNSVIIKMKNSLLYCNRDFFRENAAQLSMLATSTRNLTVFGTVMSVTQNRDNSEPFDDFDVDQLNIIPSLFSTVMLSNFGMLDNDKTILIRPIAVSFD